MATLHRLLVLLVLAATAIFAEAGDLSTEYYSDICPRATDIVKAGVAAAIKAHKEIGPALIQLFQHDCFVNGCDGSVLLDATKEFKGEKLAKLNKHSLKGFEVIDTIKKDLEKACPGLVSCADLLALAARDVVVHFGGPTWRVEVGRKDSLNASLSAANKFLPSPDDNIKDIQLRFCQLGFSLAEMVALSGAHTIGRARCISFRERIYHDEDIDHSFDKSLRQKCHKEGNDNRPCVLDFKTPFKFDNEFFKNLLRKKGLLHTDQELLTHGHLGDLVKRYAGNSSAFFDDFIKGMIKLGSLKPPSGHKGELRVDCRKVNKKNVTEENYELMQINNEYVVRTLHTSLYDCPFSSPSPSIKRFPGVPSSSITSCDL